MIKEQILREKKGSLVPLLIREGKHSSGLLLKAKKIKASFFTFVSYRKGYGLILNTHTHTHPHPHTHTHP